MKLAIIDDGVNTGRYDTGDLVCDIEVTPELAVRKRVNYNLSRPSHATACAAIIRKYAPDVPFGSIKILNEYSKRGMKDQFIKALEWCSANGIDLVNLSIGTVEFRDFTAVADAVGRLCGKGIVVVAACNNKNILTFPAALPDVIGVKCDISGKLSEGEFVWNGFAPDGIDITACSVHSIKNHSNGKILTSMCNSFAAPMITALASVIIRGNPGISVNEVKDRLRSMAVQKKVATNNRFMPDKIPSGIFIPIIAVFSESTGDVERVVCHLVKSFRNDGFYAMGLTESDFRPDEPFLAVPAQDLSMRKTKKLSECIKRLNLICKADIFVVGINDTITLDELEQRIGTDIRIYIEDKEFGMNRIYRKTGSELMVLPDNTGLILEKEGYKSYIESGYLYKYINNMLT